VEFFSWIFYLYFLDQTRISSEASKEDLNLKSSKHVGNFLISFSFLVNFFFLDPDSFRIRHSALGTSRVRCN
jgi:hypothetical protein